MCGRYAASRDPDDLVEEFEVELVPGQLPPPSWNVAPTDEVSAVLVRRPRDGGGPAQRLLRPVRWGLVPSWARDAKGGARLINARAETVAQKPAFRAAFAARRCLLPADGYFEWYATETGGRQPYYISRPDGAPLAMAGLYELWRDPAGGPEAPLVWSATVITTTATDELGHIHDRSPVLLERADWARWLDPGAGADPGLTGLLVPPGPGVLRAWPVDAAVGNVRNNRPELVEPLVHDAATLF
ncbi:putative SOS response-associated peptidase YedK [Motilibacter peucedani]|uniref:Abasic site processing protein n=1 Tax=Motilibacter peucedani TaxID=598650 RepID=A0A420XLN6_9ACTN|nr:SOS response-associated peptidase [Motilibacter peucedani]RKS71402.1 putative SOS response-associated peptidase YedK [Motilibacter peucedani]